jgi:hypothetical protein
MLFRRVALFLRIRLNHRNLDNSGHLDLLVYSNLEFGNQKVTSTIRAVVVAPLPLSSVMIKTHKMMLMLMSLSAKAIQSFIIG